MSDRYRDEEQQKEYKRLSKMSIPELQEELQERLKLSLIDEIETLPETVSNLVGHASEKILLVTMGLEYDRWDKRWELDNRKDSPFIKEIGNQAMNMIREKLPEFIAMLTNVPFKPPSWTKSIQKEYREQLYKYVHEMMDQVIEKKVKIDGDKLVAQLTKDNCQMVQPKS